MWIRWNFVGSWGCPLDYWFMADCGIGKKDRAYGCLRFEVGGGRAKNKRSEVQGSEVQRFEDKGEPMAVEGLRLEVRNVIKSVC